MKVKKRNKNRKEIPIEPVDEGLARSIYEWAEISSIKTMAKDTFNLICFPRRCQRHKNVFKLIDRGSKNHKNSTDILQLMRMRSRLNIIESLLFNNGQLAMLSLHKQRFIKSASSDSDDNFNLENDSSNC